MKGYFVLRSFSCFECPSRILHFAISLIHGFYFCWFLSWSVGQYAAPQWNWNQNCYLIMVTWLIRDIRLFAHSSSSPKKIQKGVVDYSTGRPLTHLALSINLISTFCTQFQLFALKNVNFLDCLGLIDAFSANERAEIIACILLVYQLLGTSKVWKARK